MIGFYLSSMKQKIRYQKNLFISKISKKKIEENIDFKKKKAFIFEISINGNIGDQAISIAQYNYIKNMLSDFQIIEIPANDVYMYYNHIRSILLKEDIIMIQGGGNIGNLYLSAERARTFIIKKFKSNRVLSLPQSVFFTSDMLGKRELNRSIKVYEQNSNLFVFARDSDSFCFLNDILKHTKLSLCPDIVFSMDLVKNDLKSNKILTLLRNDIEKENNHNVENTIKIWADKNNVEICKSDTMKTSLGNTAFKNRDIHFENMINEIIDSKVIITDRLHGMILSYLTGTPCIAINNSYKKVQKTYESWLSDSEYISFLKNEDISEKKLIHELSRLFNLEHIKFEPLNSKFLPLDNLISDKKKDKS